MKKILFLLFSLILLHTFTTKALACQCEPVIVGETEEQRFGKAFKEAQAIFSGKVLKIKVRKTSDNNPHPYVRVTFKVLEEWKGVKSKEVTVLTRNPNECGGFDFKKGKNYLVFAYNWESNELKTSYCTRTAELSKANKDLQMLSTVNETKR